MKDPATIREVRDYDSQDLISALNEAQYPGKDRWPLTGIAILAIGVTSTLVIATNKAPFGVRSLLGNFIFWVGLASSLVSGTFAVSHWREWLKLRKNIDCLLRDLDKTISASKIVALRTENARKADEFARAKKIWLVWAIVGQAVIFILLFAAQRILKLSLPLEPRYLPFVLVVLIPAGLYWPICMTFVIVYGRYVRNLRTDSRNAQVLELFLNKHCPYALYIRDFERESDVADAMPRGPNLPAPLEGVSRESAVLEKVAALVPVFALLNYRDLNIIPVAIRVNVEEAEWQYHFGRYAEKATLIILSTDRLSTGLEYELEWIEANAAWWKSFLLLSPEIAQILEQRFPNFKSSVRWMVLSSFSRPPKIPSDLTAYLTEVSRRRVQLLN